MANRLALELVADANPLLKTLENVQRNLDRFMTSAESAGHAVGGSLGKSLDNFINLSKGGAAAAGVLAGGFTAAASGAVALTLSAGKQMEAIDHLSQRTGIGVQALQSWSVIMAQNNFSAESLTSGMRTLSKQIVDAQNPATKAAALFDDMGVSITQLGSTETAIRAIADRFQEMPDGPEKSRLAIELFGKAGLELIPILNRGAKAFDESRRDAERFGLVLSTTQVQALTAADDAVDKLSMALDGLKTRSALVFAGSVTSGIDTMTEGIVKLTNITANYGKVVDQLKQQHPIIDALAPFALRAMGAMKASEMPPALPPEIPQGPDQNAHIMAAVAAGEKQEELGRRILTQLLHKQTLIKAEQHAQEALGRVIVQMTQTKLGTLTSEEKAQEALGRTMLQIHQRQRKDLSTELDLYFQTEQKLAVLTDQEEAGAKIVQQATEAWKHRNDTLEMAVEHAKVLDDSQQALYRTEGALMGSSQEAIQARMKLIEAEGALRKRQIEESILDETRRTAAFKNLDIELDTKRRQTIQAYPSFFQQQMLAIQQSNSFAIGQISTTWTSGLANAAVNGGNFVEQAWKSTQVAVIQGLLQFGIQKAALLAAAAANELAIEATLVASKISMNTAKNATIVAGDAAGAATGITGTFAVLTGAITGFFTATLIPFFVSIGTALMTFLSSIAAAASATIFGIPYGIAILAGVALIGAAIGSLAAFAFADGGIVTGPTMGLVGEAGSSEAVIPLNKRGASFMNEALGGGKGGGPTTIIVELDKRVISRAVFDELPSIMRLRGVPA
jgi:hypothetical protein